MWRRPWRPGVRHLTTDTLALSAMLVVAVALRLPLLGGGQIDYDEGVYWQSLRALAAGHALFASIYSSQPPAFLLLLAPSQIGFGVTLVGARLTVLVLALAGVVATYRTVRTFGSPGCGLLAAALLAADPLFFRQSIALQADGPAVALALVGLALAAEARQRWGSRAALLAAASGAALAVAVLTKLLAVAVVPALALVLAMPLRGRPGGLRLVNAAALGGGAAALALLLPFAHAWREVWRQCVVVHLEASSIPLGGLDAEAWLRELPLLSVALTGLVITVRRAAPLAAIGSTWAAGAILLLTFLRPLWPHHLVLLVAPMALLGGGIAAVLHRRQLVAIGTMIVLATTTSALYVRGLEQPAEVALPAVSALRSATGPTDLVITDDQFAAGLADRSTPPELVDTSQIRLRSGDLTTEEVKERAVCSDVRAVLLVPGRLARLPGFQDWLPTEFPVTRHLGDGRVLYLRLGDERRDGFAGPSKGYVGEAC